jgi:hypothetical protein
MVTHLSLLVKFDGNCIFVPRKGIRHLPFARGSR